MRKFLVFFLLVVKSLSAWEPLAVYTLLENHPEERMAIQWVATDQKAQTTLEFSEAGSEHWFMAYGNKNLLPGPHSLYIHRVVLEKLKADTVYHFRIQPSKEIYTFRTLPAEMERPITFVVGGDIFHDTIDYVRKMNRVAAAQNPDFAMLGGDIAYTSSKITFLFDKLFDWSEEILAKLRLRQSRSARWMEWLRAWSADMVTKDGRKIPMLTTIGNHDVDGGYDQTKEEARTFYLLFVGESPTVYRTVDIGKDISIFALDSGHTAPVEGPQKTWLYESLRERKDVPNKFAIYHVPAYPSARSFTNKYSKVVRNHWVPLFEAFGVRTAFEHHDHAYKRTVPIRNGKEDPQGVMYMGDGAWGVKNPRKPKKKLWYLAESAQKRNVIHVQVEKDKIGYTAIDEDNKILDQVGLRNQ